MSFVSFSLLVKENKKLLRNKSRYTKTKQRAYEIQRKVQLLYPEKSPEELKAVKKKIWEDLERSRIRRIKLNIISIIAGSVVFIRLCIYWNLF